MMKGYMKKMKTKRVLALLMAALMVVTLMVPETISAASSADVYNGGTTIQELLTNFQYVIREDATLNNHTVGAVAVGGSLSASANTIGDGAQSPSYAYEIYAANIGNGSGYGASTRDFYYTVDSSSGGLSDDFTQNDNYMNLDTIFGDASSGLVAASSALTTGATEYACTENSAMGFPVIDITLDENGANIVIPYEEFRKAKAININIADINYLSDAAYTISITGVGSEYVMMEGEAWRGSANSGYTDVFVNGKQSAFLSELDGQVHGIECNLSGMKLIWNFPDATGTVEWSAMGGHLVAPQAHVEVTSGRFQGGIIAETFKGVGESHFYPYGTIELNTLQNINVTKKYVDASGNSVETTEQAVFGLFTDEDCKVPLEVNGSAVTATVSASTGVASFPSESLGLLKDDTYYVKEISAPSGFEINDTVYMCQFTAGGLVSYCELGKDGVPVYSLTAPVVENLKTTYDNDEVGALIVTVLDKDSREVIEGVEITVVNNETGEVIVIKDDEGNITDTTNQNGVITYEDIAQGEYTVTMTIPEGYVSSDEYSVEVDVLHTTYHTFELELVKEPIVVYLKEEAAPNDNVTNGAWVQLQAKDENGSWEAIATNWTGSLGQTTFNDNVADEYRVVLKSDPSGWNFAATHDGATQSKTGDVIVAVSDGTDVNEYTFYFEKQVGDVVVTVYEYDATNSTTTDTVIAQTGASVTLTQADGTTVTLTDDDQDGVVTFTDIPVGDVTVELITAPNGYLKASDAALTVDTVTVTDGTAVQGSVYAEEIVTNATGTLVIKTSTTDPSVDTTGVETTITVTSPAGTTSTVTMNVIGTESITDLTPGDYIVEITTTPDNWKTTSTVKQVVTVTENNEGTAEYVFTQTGSMEITVVEKNSQSQVGAATVTVKDENDESVYTGTTTAGTNITLENLPVGDYTVTVTVPDGYKESGDTIDATIPDTATTTITVAASQVAEAKAELTLTRIGKLTVTVVDKYDTTTVVPGVVVTVTDNADNSLAGGGTTDNAGQVVVEDLPAGSYTVTYTKFASGSTSDQIYDLSEDAADTTEVVAITFTDDGEAQLEVVKATGDLTVIVKDEDTGAAVPGVKVEITGPDGTNTFTTDADGKVVLEDRELGKYTVSITDVPDNYNMPSTSSTKVTLDKDGEEVEFLLEEIKYDLTVEVRDEDTNEVVPETTVQIIDKDTNKVVAETKTDENGKITVEVPEGNYVIKVTEVPNGYDNPSNESTYTGTEVAVTDDTETVIEKISQTVIPSVTTGTLIIQVVNQNGLIDGAEVSVDSDKKSVTGGKITISDLDADDYALKLETLPADHILDPSNVAEQTASVIAGETITVVYKLLQVAEVEITITDEVTGEPIPDATVEVEIGTDSDGNPVTITGKTDTNGELTLDLPIKDNVKIEVTDVPDGYDEPADQYIDVKSGSNSVDFVVTPTGKVTVTVYDKLTGDVVSGAGVALLMKATGSGTDEYVSDSNGTKLVLTTDTDGTVTFSNLADGTYSAVVTSVPANYILAAVEANADQATVTDGSHVYALHRLYAVGSMSITVVDKATGDVVPNADVVVEGPAGVTGAASTTVNTGATGTVVLTNQIIGDYTLTANGISNYEFYGASNGSLTVVQGATAEQKFEVVQTADMTITVVDKVTGDPIPGADITVTDPYGQSADYTTDVNGQVTIDKQPVGENTVVINRVPSTNVLPDDTEETITTTVGGNNEVLIEAPQPSTETGNLTITIVDQATGVIVPGATVEIKDPSGNVMGVVTTDGNGQIKYTDIATGKYTVTIQDVPAGFTKPTGDPTYVTVKVGDNAVKLEIKKPTASGSGTTSKSQASTPNTNSNVTIEKAPKTGDISYMPFAVAMMVISVLGLAGITVYRKKTENER